ncbi:MAG: cytochrome o ubiquinol oxidase subunit IV [Burkholderiaceae bacterium]
MSAPRSHDSHAAHGHGHGHGGDHDDHHDDDGSAHSTLGGYLTGFVLSVILTAIPFWIVMGKLIATPSTAAVVLLGFAAVQIVVHMVYFLHMNARSEGGWNLLALIFTAVLVVITLSGSLWVMYHMNVNMMPTSHDVQNLP